LAVGFLIVDQYVLDQEMATNVVETSEPVAIISEPIPTELSVPTQCMDSSNLLA
jgi:hypothetical protein